MESINPIRKFLFLGLGLTRRCSTKHQDSHFIVEPDGVRTSRRNIIALAGLLVLAGFSGADPSDLDVFGVKLGNGVRGVMVVVAAVVSVQFYWYYLRYCHLKDDGIIENKPRNPGDKFIAINAVIGVDLEQKSANLISNWVAFLLTVTSWYFVGCWVVVALRS